MCELGPNNEQGGTARNNGNGGTAGNNGNGGAVDEWVSTALVPCDGGAAPSDIPTTADTTGMIGPFRDCQIAAMIAGTPDLHVLADHDGFDQAITWLGYDSGDKAFYIAYSSGVIIGCYGQLSVFRNGNTYWLEPLGFSIQLEWHGTTDYGALSGIPEYGGGYANGGDSLYQFLGRNVTGQWSSDTTSPTLENAGNCWLEFRSIV